jgi:3-phytase
MRRTAGIVALVAVTTVVGAPAQAAERRGPAQATERRNQPAGRHVLQVRASADRSVSASAADEEHRRVIDITEAGDLRVQDAAGRTVQSIAASGGGRFSGVDLVSGFALGGRRTDLAVVTDQGLDRLRVFRIEPSGRLTDVTAADAPLLFTRDRNTAATGYGLATYGRYAVVSRRHTASLGIFRLEERDGTVTYRVTDTLDLPKSFRLPDGSFWSPRPGEEPQVGGMVVDAEAGVLYAAQADVALWRITLDHDSFVGVPRIVERTAAYGIPFGPQRSAATANAAGFGDRSHADVDVATIYATGRADGYLVVSSVGDGKFYVYDRRTNRPITDLQVIDL